MRIGLMGAMEQETSILRDCIEVPRKHNIGIVENLIKKYEPLRPDLKYKWIQGAFCLVLGNGFYR